MNALARKLTSSTSLTAANDNFRLRLVCDNANGNGQVTTVNAVVAGSGVNLASSITYLPFGPVKSLTYGNSLTLSATFNSDYNPTNRTISGSIANWTYTTDNAGNITQAGPATYGYDVLNRTNAENPGTAATYTYDATDNRLTKVQGSTTTTTVPSTSNKISAVGAASYTYDAAGNISNDGTNAYTWSAAAQLATVNTTGGVYTYNVYNQRTKKVTGGVTTYYTYGIDGLLYGEYNSAGVMVREYVYLNGEPLAQIDAGSPQVLTYLHTDHLGTPRFGTNAAGASVWAWANDAFGISAPTGSRTVNLRMPGQYYDSESGLFYNWNRYYKPAIGRYISGDPIGINGGLNVFSYAGQAPANLVDPRGLAGIGHNGGPPLEGEPVILTARLLSSTAVGLVLFFESTALNAGEDQALQQLKTQYSNSQTATEDDQCTVSGGFVFRGDTRSSKVIFNQGFVAKGENYDLLYHVMNEKEPSESAFIATSVTFDEAVNFPNKVYIIRLINGIDVNQALGSLNEYSGEAEIAIPWRIDPSDIRGVTLPEKGLSRLNPNWKP